MLLKAQYTLEYVFYSTYQILPKCSQVYVPVSYAHKRYNCDIGKNPLKFHL